MKKLVRWFMEPLTNDTNTVIWHIKNSEGRHDTDFQTIDVPGVNRKVEAWLMSFPDINRVMSDSSRGLKFELYKQDPGSDVISRWEKPKRGDQMKVVLPLIPMIGDEPHAADKAAERVKKLSRMNSSQNVTYVPVYLVLRDMMKSDQDIDQLRRGFRTVYSMLLRGTFDQVAVFGDEITSGMEKIIMFATSLRIPVIGKTAESKQALANLLGTRP